MDPLSHVLLGRSFNGLDANRRLGRGAAAAFILGSLAPDIDSVLVARGWDVYMHYHVSGTHTLAAAPLLAAATAALVRAIVRAGRYPPLFAAALVGIVAGHLVFDLVSGSNMALLAPFSGRLFAPHLLTMADVSAIAIVIAGAAVSIRWRRAGAWFVIAGLGTLIVVKAASMAVAAGVYERRVTLVDAVGPPEAINGSLTRWRFYDRSGATIRTWHVDAWRNEAVLAFTRAMPDDAAVDRTRGLPAVRRFLGFAELPFARIEDAAGERRVLWSDAKYCDESGCALSFGAIVDGGGVPVREIVEVGGYIITRELSP